MKPVEIKSLMAQHGILLPFNKTWAELDLRPVQYPAHLNTRHVIHGVIGASYEIRTMGKKKPRYWLSFDGVCYEILPATLRTIVKAEMEYKGVEKTASSIIKNKGSRFAWQFAERVSRVISKYPLSNKRRQALADLAIATRTKCKIF